MSFIRNIFKMSNSKDELELSQTVSLKVFVDHLTSRTEKPLTFKVKREMKIKDLRFMVATEKKVNADYLVLLINYRIWDENKTIADFIADIGDASGGYVVYAVIITEADEATIDYDIEKYLKEKYSIPELVDSSFDMAEEPVVDMKKEELAAVPVVCSRCVVSKARESIITLDYCKHEFCKDCLCNIVNTFIGNIIKCPHQQCGRALIDHEIQKIFGAEKYYSWQNVIARKSRGDPDFVIPKTGWICDMCTFLNKPYLKFCDTCNDNRPSDYQIPIFYEPCDEEKLIAKKDAEEKKKLEMEIIQQEKEKNQRLQELKNLSEQSLMYSKEVTECPICVMEYQPGEAIVLHSCLHTICKDCLKNYLLNIVDAQVKCPTENCIGLVEDREIESILSIEEFNKYQDLNLRMAEAKEKFSFHCKAVNCTAWIINEGNIDKFKCPKCNAINCVKCEAIHSQQTCQEYQLIKTMAANDPSQSKNDLYIQSLIDSGNAMKCPGCRMIVEKNRGCDGVLCRSCGMMICWATKGPRWGPKGKGDRSGGCGCRFLWGRRCHPNCHYCH